MKTLHLHVCTRSLGIDLGGGITSIETGKKDCVLRAPAIRPRHWARICSSLPRNTAPKGLDVVFPERISTLNKELKIIGGSKINWETVLRHDEEDEDEWDNADEEEINAMKVITSAMNVKKMDEVDIEQYPHFVIPDLGSVKRGARVDALLKVLLPVVKVVAKNQAEDKERAMVAAELRDKREKMKKQRKAQNDAERTRKGYLNG